MLISVATEIYWEYTGIKTRQKTILKKTVNFLPINLWEIPKDDSFMTSNISVED